MDTLIRETAIHLYALVGDGPALDDCQFSDLVDRLVADRMTPARA